MKTVKYNHKGVAVMSSSYPEGWSEDSTVGFNKVFKNVERQLYGGVVRKTKHLVKPSTFKVQD